MSETIILQLKNFNCFRVWSTGRLVSESNTRCGLATLSVSEQSIREKRRALICRVSARKNIIMFQ